MCSFESGGKSALQHLHGKSAQKFQLVPKTSLIVISTFEHFTIEEVKSGKKVLSTFPYQLYFY